MKKFYNILNKYLLVSLLYKLIKYRYINKFTTKLFNTFKKITKKFIL